MLAALLAYSSYAQEAADAKAPVVVKVNTVKGVDVYDIVVNPDAKLTSEEALKKALAAAMEKIDPKSANAKAISAAFVSIKAALADKNAPLVTPMAITVKVENRLVESNNVAVVSTVVTSGSTSYESNTETTVNAATNVAQTTGNVVVKAENGTTSSLPVSVGSTASGEVVGSVGNTTVADTAVPTPEVTVPTTPSSEQNADNPVETMPDSTVVTSGK